MKVRLTVAVSVSSTRLGDWYATYVVLERRQFILVVSSAIRLCVILNAAPFRTVPQRLSEALEDIG